MTFSLKIKIMKNIICVLCFLLPTLVYTQNESGKMINPNPDLPYFQIPEYPETTDANNILARMIDGLGFRYYWVTEGLRSEDLSYLPGNEGRSSEETLEHIYGLSKMILNAISGFPNIRPSEEEKMDFEKMRVATLNNFKKASDKVKSDDPSNVENYEVIFQRAEKTSKFPVFNLINGPITDAIYHCGQIVSFRRSSGNPVNPFVNVFLGKTGK